MKNKKDFYLFWATQSISTLGSSMTSYALILWVFKQTNSAFNVSLLSFCSYVPYIITSTFIGPFIDTCKRKRTLLTCDVLAASCSFSIFLLLYWGTLEVIHVLLVNILIGFTNAVASPLHSVTMGTLIQDRKYEHLSGLLSFSNSLSVAFTPVFATVAFTLSGFTGVLLIDIGTFLVAFLSLVLLIKIPERQEMKPQEPITFIKDTKTGYSFLAGHKGLLNMMLFMCLMNFLSRLTYENILPAMLLSRSGSPEVLATVTGIIGIGGIVGGLCVSFSPLPKNKVRLMFLSAGFSFLFGDLLMAIGQDLRLWIPAAIAASLPIPFISASQHYVLYTSVPEKMQGKVFATRNAIQYSAIPLGILLGGWLSDFIFEPLMQGTSSIAIALRAVLGQSSGTGMAIMFLCTGILGSCACIFALNNRTLKTFSKEAQSQEVASQEIS